MSATLDAFQARRGKGASEERHLAVLREQLERLRRLMQDLLEYGKPPSLELATTDLTDVVQQALEMSGAATNGQRTRVTIRLDRGLPRVRADRLRLGQVFSNLITNALQHSSDTGDVTVEGHALEQHERLWIEVTVADHGAGFRPDDLPHVFEPFFSRRRGGTGLGLALVQRIVEQHGGTVVAANRRNGGALVRVRLPIAE